MGGIAAGAAEGGKVVLSIQASDRLAHCSYV
jgi:hypothetical protein